MDKDRVFHIISSDLDERNACDAAVAGFALIDLLLQILPVGGELTHMLRMKRDDAATDERLKGCFMAIRVDREHVYLGFVKNAKNVKSMGDVILGIIKHKDELDLGKD